MAVAVEMKAKKKRVYAKARKTEEERTMLDGEVESGDGYIWICIYMYYGN